MAAPPVFALSLFGVLSISWCMSCPSTRPSVEMRMRGFDGHGFNGHGRSSIEI
jgi:hypothetical protein